VIGIASATPDSDDRIAIVLDLMDGEESDATSFRARISLSAAMKLAKELVTSIEVVKDRIPF
jgi:hypothetical protein